MRNVLTPSILVVLTALAFPAPVLAQWSPMDFSGVWTRVDPPGSNSDSFTLEELAMTPWAEKRYRLVRKDVQEGQQAREDMDRHPVAIASTRRATCPRKSNSAG